MITFDELRNRYELTCRLRAEAALHIGTGVGSTVTDAPFIRQDGAAFLPGSSLRGALRSQVERILQSLGLEKQCCVLFSSKAQGCHCEESSEEQEKLLNAGALRFCPVCTLFGSTGMASKLKVGDATQIAAARREPVRRDGVGIDRDTGTAREKIKYDFEVLEQNVEFLFHLSVENMEQSDQALLYIALREMEQGLDVGGKKARGLGRVKLTGYEVAYFDNSRDWPLRKRITGGLKTEDRESFENHLKTQFQAFFGPGA